jgi:hypothetical protein
MAWARQQLRRGGKGTSEVHRVAWELRRNWRCRWIGSSGFVGPLPLAYAALEKSSKLEFGWAPIKAGWGWLAEWVVGGAMHVMQWTEMAPPCRFDIAAYTVMAAGREEGGVRALRDPGWRDATERHTRRRYEPRRSGSVRAQRH